VKGVTPDGEVIELTEKQAAIVRDVRRWALGHGILALPHMARQSGKSVIMATVAEYDARNWPEDLPLELGSRRAM
jgi:hypothetical protein